MNKWSQANKDYSIKVVTMVIAKDPREGVQMQKNLVAFFATVCHIPEHIDEQFGHFELRNFLKELCQVVLIKRTTILQEYLYGCFC